jgi:hypothetical protein
MATSKGKTPPVAPVEAPEVVEDVVKTESIESGVNSSEQTAEVTETVNTVVNEEVKDEQSAPPKLGVVSIESEVISDDVSENATHSGVLSKIATKLYELGFLQEGDLIESGFALFVDAFEDVKNNLTAELAKQPEVFDGFTLKRGVEVQLFDGGAKLRLLNDAFVEKTIAESTFVGNLAMANPAFVGMHNDTFKLNYGGDGQLQPLSAHTTPENLPKFISTLTRQEAMLFQISESDWKANQPPTEE